MLRDQHRRERQREKERRESGVGLQNYRPWRFSAILSFLNPFIDARAAGANGCVLDRNPTRLQGGDTVGCSTTTEPRSDDENTGVAVADATTTSPELVQRQGSSSSCGAPVGVTEVKMEAGPEGAVSDERPRTPHVNTRELFEMMMQSVTSLAASFASSHSSSLHSSPPVLQADLQPPRDLQPSCSASSLSQPKGEEQEAAGVALSDKTDGEEEYHSVSPGPARLRRRSSECLLEEHLRRMEAREARRDWDLDQRDDVSLFLLSLAPALRRLAPEKQSWVRTKIQQLLHEAQFGPTRFQ
ncbi:uncharacterized protein [Antennarius striatus]